MTDTGIPNPDRPFDYNDLAELFPVRSRRSSGRTVGYRRFEHASDAIRFAIEELQPELLLGTYMEVGDDRFDGAHIRSLYDDAEYPLVRRMEIVRHP